jgi:tetrapyrrole methylase family protein/MazG family protein
MELEEKFLKLVEIMKELRSENGCPWDKKQTHQSLRPYVIEEAYEVAYSIDKNDLEELSDELGDLLLQVIFHSQIAEENKEFTIEDVLDKINSKMIRRHPHVFKNDDEYSYERWEQIKAKEKKKESYSMIGELKKSQPSLIQLRRLLENMTETGTIMFSDSNKLKELFIEAINSEDTNKIILYFFIYFLNKDLDLEREISKTTNKLYEQFIEIEKNNKEKLKNFEKIIIKNKI